jgi:hypothetical protein
VGLLLPAVFGYLYACSLSFLLPGWLLHGLSGSLVVNSNGASVLPARAPLSFMGLRYAREFPMKLLRGGCICLSGLVERWKAAKITLAPCETDPRYKSPFPPFPWIDGNSLAASLVVEAATPIEAVLTWGSNSELALSPAVIGLLQVAMIHLIDRPLPLLKGVNHPMLKVEMFADTDCAITVAMRVSGSLPGELRIEHSNHAIVLRLPAPPNEFASFLPIIEQLP